MNKVLYGLVYVFLALAGAGLYFELEVKEKSNELTEQRRTLNSYLAKISRTIEKAEPAKDAAFEIKKDTTAVEARIVDSPDMDNILESYQGSLEQANLATYELSDANLIDNATLDKLFESAKTQQARLNSTRAALAEMREKLEGIVNELNKLKGDARQDKVSVEEEKTKCGKLEEEKAGLENQVTKIKGQIDGLNGEIVSLKDEVTTAKDDRDAAKEETAEVKKHLDQLKKLLQESIQTRGNESSGSGTAVTTLPFGDKGKVVKVDNESMFAIVSFSDEALKDLKGNDLSKPLPSMELGVKRPGFKGPAGEFIGRIRLRQEVKGQNYVICYIIGSWAQDKIQKDDVVFAD